MLRRKNDFRRYSRRVKPKIRNIWVIKFKITFASLKQLILNTICRLIGHFWEEEGGRPCPINQDQSCFQEVYKCVVCGTLDYGETGGPAYDDCRFCIEKNNKEV